MSTFHSLAVVMVITALASSARADEKPADPLPHPLRIEKLGNGLTVVMERLGATGIVTYDTLVGAGSRDEVEPGKSGYAHLFEHLMFRGTDAVSAEEYGHQLEAMGASDDATTTEDFTLFETTIPADALGTLITLNADRFQHLRYAVDAYKDETGAVLGERSRFFASPDAVSYEALIALGFRQHTYGHTPIGSKHDVEDMPNQYEYSRAFFRRFYTPDDCTLFVVGDFDPERTLGAIKEAYGGWHGTRARTAVKTEPEQKAPRVRALVWHDQTTPRVMIAYHVPPARASLADSAALVTLLSALFDEPSELYQRLVVREQKVLSLIPASDSLNWRDSGLFQIEAQLAASASFDEVIGAVQAAVNAAARGELGAEKIQAARDHLVSKTILRTQTPLQLAEALAVRTSSLGDPRGFERSMEALAAVKPEDVARVARMLTAAHRDVVTLRTTGEPTPEVHPRAVTK